MRGMSVALRGAGTAALIAAFALSAQAAQGQVVGTFNASGSATIAKPPTVGAPATITFTSSTTVGTSPTPDGIFLPIAPGTTGITQTITVGSGAYSVPNFFQIAGYTFSITNVTPGNYASTSCSDPAAAGQTCTIPGTPFNLVNTAAGGGLNSTLSFSVSGLVTVPSATTYDYSATFTSQFTSSYQQVINEMDSGGTAPNSYSVVLQATQPGVTTTPEPTTFAMLGSGLLGLVGMVRVRRRAA